MIRRVPVSPKAIALFAIGCCLAMAAGPVAQRFLVHAAGTALGVNLSIDRTSIALFSSELNLSGVELAHAHDSKQQIMATERVSVDVEGSPLLRRKLVIRNATATGVRLLTSPLSTAELAKRWPLPQHWKLQVPAQKMLQTSLSEATAAIQTDPLANSSTLALLDVLSTRGPQQTLDLQNDLTIYELRAERLAEIASALPPSADTTSEPKTEQAAKQALLELKDLEENISAYRKRINEAHKNFQSDRQRLMALKEQDLARISARGELQIPNPQTLDEFFLGAAASQRSWEILRFVHWAQEYLPRSQTDSQAPRSAGLTIPFPERHPLPEFVLRALHFEGQGKVADKTFHFAGTLQNLTNNPQGFAEPARLVIDAKVPHRVVVEAIMDRTQEIPRDRIVVRCPSWPQPQQMLGNANLVGIAARPCLLSLRAELNFSQGNVSGTVRMRQQRLELTPRVADSLGGRRVQSALVEMLSQIDTIDYEVQLNGPIDSPSLALSSSLGERVAGGLQHAFEKEHSLHATELTQRLTTELDSRIADWEQATTTAQQALLARVGTTLEQVQLLDSLVQQHLPREATPRAEVTLRPQRTQNSPATSTERK